MKKIIITMAVCLVGTTAVHVSATAQERPVLGLNLGQKLDRGFPTCVDNRSNATDYCAEFKPVDVDAPPSTARLLRPYENSAFPLPEWLDRKLAVHVSFDANGVLTKIVAYTAGRSVHDRVIESLTERFGKPTRQTVRKSQNAYGATWIVATPEWSRPNLSIELDCVSIETCFVRFRTPAQVRSDAASSLEQKKRDAL